MLHAPGAFNPVPHPPLPAIRSHYFRPSGPEPAPGRGQQDKQCVGHADQAPEPIDGGGDVDLRPRHGVYGERLQRHLQ